MSPARNRTPVLLADPSRDDSHTPEHRRRSERLRALLNPPETQQLLQEPPSLPPHAIRGQEKEPAPEAQMGPKVQAELENSGGRPNRIVAVGAGYTRVIQHRVRHNLEVHRILAEYTQLAAKERDRPYPNVASVEIGHPAENETTKGIMDLVAVVHFATPDGDKDPEWAAFWQRVTDVKLSPLNDGFPCRAEVKTFSPLLSMRRGEWMDDDNGAGGRTGSWLKKARGWIW